MVHPGARDRRPLAERLRPTRLNDVLGNSQALRQLRTWAAGWEAAERGTPRRRAVILEGPPGVGKTTAAIALARDRGWAVVEMNASDARNPTALGAVAGRASLTNTLGVDGKYRGTREGGRTLILLDEADCLSGRAREEGPSKPAGPTLREFLRGRYRSVDALAEAWGLGRPGAPAAFESWEAVPTTGGRGGWTKLREAQRDLSDWRIAGRPTDLSDRGGLGAIARLVRETRQPLVLTVNDPTSLRRYSSVFRTDATTIRFQAVGPSDLEAWLSRVARAEGITLRPELIARIVQRSRGDVRAAVTDLEAVAPAADPALAESFLAERDEMAHLEALVEDVLAHPRFYRSVEIQDRHDGPPDEVFPWIEENAPRMAPSPRIRFEALGTLGSAEEFLAKARRHRVWSLWSYATELMTGGVSTVLGDAPRRGDYVSFPEMLRAMGGTKGARAARTDLLRRVGRAAHLSRRKGNESMLPFLEALIGRAPAAARAATQLALRRAMIRELGLTREDVAFLLGVDPEAPEVGASFEEQEPSPDTSPEEETPAPEARVSPGTETRKVQRHLGEF